MSKKLWSLSSLSAETGRNFRTLSRALAGVKADGKIAGRPAFYMATAIAALDQHERRTGRVQSKAAPERFDPTLEAQIASIEEWGAAVDRLLTQLRAERSVERRRAMVEAGAGKCVGRYERSLAATIGDGPDAFLRKLFVDEQMSFVISEVCTLCEWLPLVKAGGPANGSLREAQ